MKLAQGGGRKGAVEEINITPLTDVFLVLLVIMMVVAPMSRRVESDVRPPEIVSGSMTSQTDTIIEIREAGQFVVNGEELTAEQLRTVLQAAMQSSPQKHAALRADRSVKSRSILDAMAIAQEAGVEKLTVIGEAGSPPPDETAQ